MRNLNGFWLPVVFWLLAVFGWFANIYKLCQYDFDTPVKAEVIRVIGIPIAPLGAIIGYIDIEDGKKKN